MATIASDYKDNHAKTSDLTAKSVAKTVLVALGSLKLTVALFALSMVTVLVGTLAQDEMNMQSVKERYFLSWIAPLHVDDFFPQAFFPHEEALPMVVPFPGGALIGLLLMVNLLAAKTTRFRIHTSGGRLWGGVGLIALGSLVTALIVMTGHSSEGLQGTPPISYDVLWGLVLSATAALAAILGIVATKVNNSTIKWITYAFAVAIGLFVAYALFNGFRIGDPGLRIVWQLTKGLGAGVILLFGCLMVFDKQGGNLLLHLGVGLLMVGQFTFGDRQLEQRLSLVEGQSSNTLVNLDEIEMTFIENLAGKEKVTAIPSRRLLAAAETQQVISDASLPVDVRVVEYYINSTLRDPKGENLATVGEGLRSQAVEMKPSGGTDSEMNLASAYVELLEKENGESLGVYLISQMLSDREMLKPDGTTKDIADSITVDGTTYDIGLKFHREVKPYWVQLEDVRRVDYSGTDTPRDYSSYVRIIDTETGEDRRDRVWMNNPLRYRGETFYQSSYTPLPSGKEMTGIQVVRNSGWLIPYVACSITALGMLAHFLGTLTRFLRRRERENLAGDPDPFDQVDGENTATVVKPANGSQRTSRLVPATVASFGLLALIFLVPWQATYHSLRPQERATEFDFYAAGKMPVQFGGRVMPLDAYARQTLKAMSNKESIPLELAPAGIRQRVKNPGSTTTGKVQLVTDTEKVRGKLSALQWLMEVAVDSPEVRFLPMFRIDSEEVRSELELDRRESKLYSLDEIGRNWGRVSETIDALVKSRKPVREQSFKERKLLELDRRTRHFTLTAAAFRLPVPDSIPAEEFEKMFPGADASLRELFALRELERRMSALKEMQAPRIVPPFAEEIEISVDDPDWKAFGPAFFDYYSEVARSGADPDAENAPDGIGTFEKMIKAYSKQDTEVFNAAVDDHLENVQADPIPGYKPGRISLERWMESQWPTGIALILYLIALVMGLIYFAVGVPQLRQAVWASLALTLVLHTVVLGCRIWITGRAPVINIYSSAVFIGWGTVAFALVMERLFRYGIGNVMAAASGALTLLVAYGLSTGDTMPVLQAVLDTQFWLATHVISVTLGYVATLVAGTLGVAYLATGWLGGSNKLLRDLYRCCYGAACFGILFSFVGTVLGGLWADDSWGRFWGWDPKENGALLIVIWNALMLHARWDGMVKGRGFAALAIGGNIVTAWSWFGTNELGIGLHSYGFTSGVLMWLTIFVASQFVIVILDGVMRYVGVPFGSRTK